MLRAEFEPATPARERPQTDALARASTGIDNKDKHEKSRIFLLNCIYVLSLVVNPMGVSSHNFIHLTFIYLYIYVTYMSRGISRHI